MKECYIIGNGFDLHHGLNTSYENYKKYLMEENPEYVKEFDDFLERYVFVKENYTSEDPPIEKWSELEKYTERIYDYDLNEILDEAVESVSKDEDRAGYWHDIQYMCEVYSKWINGIRTSFADWIRTIECEKGKKDNSLSLSQNALYLTFNYTATLERLYGIPVQNILHIHGDVNHEIIFGNDKEPNEEIHDNRLPIHHGSDWRINESAQILNDVLKETHAYYKNTLSIIKANREFFEEIRQCKTIIFMGFGFGEEDSNYVKEIFHGNDCVAKVIVYYHAKEDRKKFHHKVKEYLKENVIVEYKNW